MKELQTLDLNKTMTTLQQDHCVERFAFCARTGFIISEWASSRQNITGYFELSPNLLYDFKSTNFCTCYFCLYCAGNAQNLFYCKNSFHSHFWPNFTFDLDKVYNCNNRPR